MAENKIRLTKEGTQDRMVTQSQLQPFLDRGFTQVEDTTPIQPVQAPTDPAQLKAFNFAQQKPQPMTPETLSEAQPITVPEVTQPPQAPADIALTSATASIADIMKQLTPATTETEVKEQTLLDQMAELTGELGQQAADQLTAEQSSQIPELRQQFADINSKILAKNAEFNTLQASFDQANLITEGKPITLASQQGQKAQDFRMFLAQKNALAAEAGFLQAQAQGLQGKITDAQNTVNRAIDLKYSTIQAQLQTRQAQLQAIQPQLNREEKKQALAQQILINNQMRELEDAKANDKQIQNIMLEAVSSGITNSEVLAQISNSTSVNQAISILGQNAPEAEVGTQVVQVGNRKLLINTQTGETIRDLGGTVTGGTGGGIGGAITTGQIDIPEFEAQTFDAFIKEKEEELLQSIADPEKFRQEFEQQTLEDAEQFADEQLRKEEEILKTVSPEAKLAFEDVNFLDRFTPTEQGKLLKELTRAGLQPGGLGVRQEDKLRTSFIKESADFKKQIESIGRVRASVSDPSPAGDLALIFNFMKTLDPASVVRESEFATASNTGSVPQRIWAQYNRVLNGQRLSAPQREDFEQRAEVLFNSAKANQRLRESEFERLARSRKVDPTNVIIKFGVEEAQSVPVGEQDDIDLFLNSF